MTCFDIAILAYGYSRGLRIAMPAIRNIAWIFSAAGSISLLRR